MSDAESVSSLGSEPVEIQSRPLRGKVLPPKLQGENLIELEELHCDMTSKSLFV